MSLAADMIPVKCAVTLRHSRPAAATAIERAARCTVVNLETT